MVFFEVNFLLISEIQYLETGLHLASVNNKLLYFDAFIPNVNAYFLLPQKASLFSTFKIFRLAFFFVNNSTTSFVLSEEALLINTISNFECFCSNIDGRNCCMIFA